MAKTRTSKKLTVQELAELHALPNESPVTPHQAAAFLGLSYSTLASYRCYGGGPKFLTYGPKLVHYRMGDLREYVTGRRQSRSEGTKRSVTAMLASRGIMPKWEA